MAARTAARAPGDTLRVSGDAWRGFLTSAACVRFLGRIPYNLGAQEAVSNFGQAVGDLVRELQRAVDDTIPPLSSRLFASKTKGSSVPSVVSMEITMPREMVPALLDRRDSRGFVPLPAPWGGLAALFTGSSGEVRSAHLLGLPPRLPLTHLQDLLRKGGIPVHELCRVPDPATGFERGDMARLVVPATTKLPDDLTILEEETGNTLASIRVRPISSLPPAPGGEASGSYAAAAAGVPLAGSPPSRPPPGSSAVAAAAVAAGQPSRQPVGQQSDRGALSPDPGQGTKASETSAARQPASQQQRQAGSQRGSGVSRGRSRSPMGSPRARAGSVGRRSAASPARRHPADGVALPGTAKKQIVTAADGKQAAIPSANRFDRLSDMTDMDTDANTMAAQMAATTTAAHGSGSGGAAC